MSNIPGFSALISGFRLHSISFTGQQITIVIDVDVDEEVYYISFGIEMLSCSVLSYFFMGIGCNINRHWALML